MKVSTQTQVFCETYGIEDGLIRLCDAGYDALDLSLYNEQSMSSELFGSNWIGYAEKLRNLVEDRGLRFNQAHAPMISHMDERIKQAIRVAGVLGVDDIVVHPLFVKENNIEENIAFYDELEPIAVEYGIKIAVENMFGWDDLKNVPKPAVLSVPKEFNAVVDRLSDHFVACLDIGHAALTYCRPDLFIREITPGRLHALHIHDNDRRYDCHTMPYTGVFDWDLITQALADIDYDGYLTLESDNTLLQSPVCVYPDLAKVMCGTARHLAKLIEDKK